MLGAIVGDVVGSLYEFDQRRDIAHSKMFPLVQKISYKTDDTVLTLAMADAVMNAIPRRGDPVTPEAFEDSVKHSLRKFGNEYPDESYGVRFMYWLEDEDPKPYNSLGNGSALPVGAITSLLGAPFFVAIIFSRKENRRC